MAIPIFVSAQMKVSANGHVSIGNGVPQTIVNLLVGNTNGGANNSSLSYGIKSRFDYSNDTTAVTIGGWTSTDDINGKTVGVFGYSSGGTMDKHFGTIGSIIVFTIKYLVHTQNYVI